MATAVAAGETGAKGPAPGEERLPAGRAVALALSDVKVAHSVFALPFAVLGAFLARDPKEGWGVFAGKLAVVVTCMVCARTWAMLVNRLADREFDAANERTRRRVFAAGRLSAGKGWMVAAGAAGLFVAATGLFWWLFGNRWPLLLSVPVLVWVAFYSYTKRFTALCHLFLGGALGVSPLAAALAVRPAALGSTPALYWLAGFVVLWVAGFDVIYALQDVEFDRERGLSSIPAKAGVKGALWASRGAHAAALAALLAAWTSEARLGALFGAAVGVVAALLVTEHAVVAKRGRAGIPMAFFTVNGVVSCVLGLAGVVELVGR